jgi:hypothetical protein
VAVTTQLQRTEAAEKVVRVSGVVQLLGIHLAVVEQQFVSTALMMI